MNKKQVCLTLIIGIISGLVGGTLASQLFTGAPAFAQKAPKHEKIILAEEFGLVNKDSQVCGKIFMTPENRPALMLFDQDTQKETILELSPNWFTVLDLLGRISQ
jgi:hypothetical protein